MFDLGRLRLLRELSQRGTMTAVAAASRLTPSAVSQQLATLESEAQVKLFEPVGRRVKLTAAGLRLAAHAETILNAVDAARIDMGIAATRPGGQLGIGCFGTFLKARVVAAVTRVQDKHPDLAVVVHELEPEDAIHAVRIGRCDAGIIYSHSLVPRTLERGFVSRTLTEEPVLLALPQRYRALPATVDLTELADCDWIGGARESEGYNLTSRACAPAGFAPRMTHSIDDYDLLLRMVAAGLGISFVPRVALDLYPDAGVIVRTPAGPPLRRTISILARPAVASSPALGAFLAELSSDLSAGVGALQEAQH
jgi:DNA-binding transcriptional LysR family regulator